MSDHEAKIAALQTARMDVERAIHKLKQQQRRMYNQLAMMVVLCGISVLSAYHVAGTVLCR